MKRPPAALASAAVVVVGTLAGCSTGDANLGLIPACERSGQPGRALVLMAQSVPTAPVLPCIRLMPTGWRLETVDIHKGASRLALGSDRDGSKAVTVTLSETCDVAGATKVPSDQAGIDRYERVTRVTAGYGGVRYYIARGGCVTYQFNLHGTSRAAPVNEASLALGFITRDAVRDKVLRDTEGRLQLDPKEG